MGATAVAILVRKERDIVEQFLSARATSDATARSLGELGLDSNIALRRLQRQAVIRETTRGTVYLDEPSWQAMKSSRRTRVVVLLAVILLALALPLIALGLRDGSREAPNSGVAQ
ncbi:MAG: hypothetical protein H7Z40_16175 [Phycisphaerae bacterium]|nr:hypothetical protein [Gemmatimonadaceae bacterium]